MLAVTAGYMVHSEVLILNDAFKYFEWYDASTDGFLS